MNDVEKLLNTPIISAPEIQGMLFMGTYDPREKYSIGNVVFMDGEALVYVGDNVFEPLGAVDSYEEVNAKEEPKIFAPVKCKCCGGNLIRYKSGYKCEYCDTEYV